MNNNYLEFIKQLKTTKVNSEFNSKMEAFDKHIYGKEHYIFHLASAWHSPTGGIIIGSRNIQSLFELDEEDIEYFKNKYLPKVNDQYQKELSQLKEKFNKNE